jgi:hypothetical protein
MKPLRFRIREAAERCHVPQPVIEKDYALSYILAGIAAHRALSNTLVFKGGTALKKLFFGDYRFSEDLDFSTIDAPKEVMLETAIRESVAEAGVSLSAQGPFRLELERYLERDPHPGGQEAFVIRVQFPWHPSPLCRIKVEITHDEPVLLAPQKRFLIHGYEENLAAEVCCYQLDEIVAEKLRALLQMRQKLLDRGWSRPRARDYYDLWRILTEFGGTLEQSRIKPILDKKCVHRGVTYLEWDDLFGQELVSEASRSWNATLKPFVRELPECLEVLDRLKTLLRDLLPDLTE